MPWLTTPRRQAAARTIEELSTDIRVLRSTVAAQASSIATLATSVTRLDARVEAALAGPAAGTGEEVRRGDT